MVQQQGMWDVAAACDVAAAGCVRMLHQARCEGCCCSRACGMLLQQGVWDVAAVGAVFWTLAASKVAHGFRVQAGWFFLANSLYLATLFGPEKPANVAKTAFRVV